MIQEQQFHFGPCWPEGGAQDEGQNELAQGLRVVLEMPWPWSGRERREMRKQAGERNMVLWDWGEEQGICSSLSCMVSSAKLSLPSP